MDGTSNKFQRRGEVNFSEKTIDLYCILKKEKNIFILKELLVRMKERRESLHWWIFSFPLVNTNTETKYFAIIGEKAEINICYSPHHIALKFPVQDYFHNDNWAP